MKTRLATNSKFADKDSSRAVKTVGIVIIILYEK